MRYFLVNIILSKYATCTFSSLKQKMYITGTFSRPKLDMAKRAGRVRFESSQTGCGSKTGHFKRVKNRFELIKLRVRSGWFGLTFIFHMNFFFYKENNMLSKSRKVVQHKKFVQSKKVVQHRNTWMTPQHLENLRNEFMHKSL